MELKSVGMMIPFPTEWKNKIHVPNHQSDHDFERMKNDEQYMGVM
jgi:hypothetical protein